MIKAYHQVGTEADSDEQLEEAFDDVLGLGVIEPAIRRLDRHEMEFECFYASGVHLKDRFPKATLNALKALTQIAEEKIRELPESGFIHTMFNCVDLLAGDLEFIFLKTHGWYAIDNGFVFEAEDLVRRGARFRRSDLLGVYNGIIEATVERKYPSVRVAKKEIKKELRDIRKYTEYSGRDALDMMQEGPMHETEVVWPGDLPLSLAIEAWRNGKRVR